MLQRDPDCEPLYGSGFVCEDQICVEAPDPCDPSPCGPGAISTPNGQTCQCTCPSGFLGDPNVECIQVFKQIYQGYLPLSVITSFRLRNNENHSERIIFQGECQIDDECPLTEACEDYYCKDPCKQDTCQKEYFCKVIRHIPTCGLQYVPEEPEVNWLLNGSSEN